MTVLSLKAGSSPTRGSRHATSRWQAPTLVSFLLIGGGALFTAAILAWAVLELGDLMTGTAFTLLGTMACAGAAALHAAGALAAVRELMRP